MISSVCQGVQSHVLSFRLDVHRKCEVEENSKYGVNGEGWGFLEAVTTGNEEDKVYVHPLVKNSSTKLSKKSLEMCTESLGSESGTGSDMGENGTSLMTTLDVRCSTWMHKKAKRRATSRYPPPLTSISGSRGVRMESYREDGRLVLRAVAGSACHSSYFHAERSQGRLKLQLVKHVETVEEVLSDDDEKEEEEEEEEEANWGTEEIGMENFGRPRSCSGSRCKQGTRQSKELLTWNPRWVST